MLAFRILLKQTETHRFDCPNFEALDKEKCHYEGKTYNSSEFIEKEHVAPCESACFCGWK